VAHKQTPRVVPNPHETCALVYVLGTLTLLAAGCREAPAPAARTEKKPSATQSAPLEAPDRPVPAAEQERLCAQGDTPSCLAVADRLRNSGQGREALTRALWLYQSACDRHVADGCAGLGAMYQDGLGVAQDSERALSLYRRSCDAKSGRGCARLGALHAIGRGVPKDLERARGFSEAGCELDDGLACMNLGVMYERADGVPRDEAQAKVLYSKACKLKEGGGCRQLGQLYARGFAGQAPNPKLALLFAENACALDDASGCGNAGMNHQVGFGTAAEPQRAARFYKRACTLGEARYCELLERFK
jgi:uncharacterized protein